MLTALDETLLHQAAVPFALTTVSDHRFFDRMWLGGHRADGTRFLMGMANYKNMNVADGYFVVLKDRKQHNLRVSRPFLSSPDALRVGPLKLEIVRPLEQLRIVVDAGSEHSTRAELTFTGTAAPRMELPHVRRVDGRLTQDYVRFDQHGFVNGWFELNGERTIVDRWFGARDHSWGVRPNQGGYDPVTSDGDSFRDEVSGASSALLAVYLFFDVEGWEGYIQLQEDGSGRVLYQDGEIRNKRRDAHPVALSGLTHDLEFAPGTRACTGGRINAKLTNGEVVQLDITALVPATCYKGTGYDAGFDDERGLGLYRGERVERDVYDVSHVENVVLPDGRTIRPWHREVPCTLSVNGGPRGLGYFPVLSNGFIERYRLEGGFTNRRAV
ncbi:MAG: hypothetical protein ABW034_08965 [Steroidobacteraceae bacterium]